MKLHIVWTGDRPAHLTDWWPTFVVDEVSLDHDGSDDMRRAIREAEGNFGHARVVVIELPDDALYAQLTKEPDAIPAEVQP